MTQETTENETDEFCEEKMNDMVHRHKVRRALQQVLHQAQVNGHLVCGVHDAANELAVDLDTIGLCLLVENPSADPGIQVHCRLIEAYCWECAIPVIKVNSSRKLCEMTKHYRVLREPLHCVLVKNLPTDVESVSTVLQFARHSPAPLLKIT
ncbi:growth arrest and DNA damage-inducible protein GADD45 beta-like [Orbicella faveolata]|uniref:growth arrest and DNA damage-inducible protein GADD45 beta-like n=1 Tax=Orbicella faveolata TaxID=48498 RepID=UPI0009E308C6|nr:growth arrest and DNA damage-inducible protein GADD45 beta-like [Orbicella faveolata]